MFIVVGVLISLLTLELQLFHSMCGSVLKMFCSIYKDHEQLSNGHLFCYSWEYLKTLSGDSFCGDGDRQTWNLFCATAMMVYFISVLYLTSKVESCAVSIRETFSQAISYVEASRLYLKIPSTMSPFCAWLPKGLQSHSKLHITIIETQVKWPMR